jgi:hypothetical protein
MQQESLTNHIAHHIAAQQNSAALPLHQTDQINAAALNGADFFDRLSSAGRQTGTFEVGPVDSSQLFTKLAERYGDPFTKLHACRHLSAAPAQPGYIHAADPSRVFCRTCFTRFLVTEADVMQRYADSTDCDACDQGVEQFHPASISNGMVTYIVNVCGQCLPSGAQQSTRRTTELEENP